MIEQTIHSINTVGRQMLEGEQTQGFSLYSISRNLAETQTTIVNSRDMEQRTCMGFLVGSTWEYALTTMDQLQGDEGVAADDDIPLKVAQNMAHQFGLASRRRITEIADLPESEFLKSAYTRIGQLLPFGGLPISPAEVISTKIGSNFVRAVHTYQALFPLATQLVDGLTVEEAVHVVRPSYPLVHFFASLDDKDFQAGKGIWMETDEGKVSFNPDCFQITEHGIDMKQKFKPPLPTPDAEGNLPGCSGLMSSKILEPTLTNIPDWTTVVRSTFTTYVNRVEQAVLTRKNIADTI